VVASLAAVTVNVAAAYLGAGIDSFLLGSCAGTVVTTASALWASRRLHSDRRIWWPSRPVWHRDRLVLGTSAVLLVAGLVRVTDVQLGKIVTSHFLGADATAAYTVAATLAGIGITAAVAPSAGLLTAVAECGLDQRGRKVLDTSADLSAAGAAFCAAGLFVLGPGLLRIWLRQDVPGADGALRWLAVAVVPTTVSIVAAALLVAVRRERPMAVLALVALGVNVGASIVGARLWGLSGVAAAMVVTYAVHVVGLTPLARGAALPVVKRACLHVVAMVPLCLVALGLDAALGGMSTLGWFVEAVVFTAAAAATLWWVCQPGTRQVLVGYVRRVKPASGS
jgi:O-antigen/teichoic acid export membrane protein